MDKIAKKIQEEFSLGKIQTENVITLMDEGNTIPFIARYRKEKTGELDDKTLREISERLTYLRTLEERRSEVFRLISEQEAMTDEIAKNLENAKTQAELEDIYRPFKPKRKTRASIAKEKGLSPLAEAIKNQTKTESEIYDLAKEYISEEKGVETEEEAVNGALDIIAEEISDNADFRKTIREITVESGILCSKAATEEDSTYRMYYDYKEPAKKIANHRLLAVNRGEKEGFLKVTIETDEERILKFLVSETVNGANCAELLKAAAADSYKRLIAPSIENEVRAMMTEKASEDAIRLFGINLHNLLLTPPIKDKVVLGLDPAYRTGCKIAVVDGTGKVLGTSLIYCTLKNHDMDKAREQLLALIKKYDVDIIAIGNGTATKESEIFVAETIAQNGLDTMYAIVNESGASVYSASKLGAEEFPDFDVTQRSAVSIARRLQDPLAEFVKIEPRSIGVGQYQHDMNQKRLSEALGGVVEDCVNSVGVDLNTASAPLLSYIAGIGAQVAKNIVSYREENGRFTNRKQLMKVPKLGAKAFLQCAGFLRIPDGDNPLDNTSVHPESYPQTEALIKSFDMKPEDIANNPLEFRKKAQSADLKKIAQELRIGAITLRDVIDAVSKPGRDMREELPSPELKSELLSAENLSVGMVLKGTVRNVTDFGAFVDIGVHQDGLLHISQIANRYIKHPTDVLSVGDVVKVKVIGLETDKNRISLSMKEAEN